MKKVFFHPLFWVGLVVRLGLLFVIIPDPVTHWYVPFLNATIFSFDPWGTWLAQGGELAAFPYGYAMWFIFLPLILLFKILGWPLVYSYGLTLLAADIALLTILCKIFPRRHQRLLAIYWYSPIVIVASYFLGLNDLIPVLLLTVSLYYIKQLRFALAGFVCMAAVSAKLSMVLAVPFILIYLIQNKSLRQFIFHFLKGAVIGTIVFLMPFALSSSGINMLFNNHEMEKVYQLAFSLNSNTQIYLVPLVYFLLIYTTWWVKRLNFNLFHTMLGITFLLIVLMTPASPGWFIWAVPLLSVYQASSNNHIAIVLSGLFSMLYILSTILTSGSFHEKMSSLVHTTMIATGIILIIKIWQESIKKNDYFRLSRKPFTIGVAGDSGSGKDTFISTVKGLFGDHSVTTLSGDNYHLWDRQKPMWQIMTHLNPMANNLEGFTNDLIALVDGKSIHTRHYDHTDGRMGRLSKTKSNDIIIAGGLHSLYFPILRQCYDLSIYLNIDEELRKYFKFQRDMHQRGHTEKEILSSFKKREPDSKRFIRPQADYADLILSMSPIRPPRERESLKLRLTVCSRLSLNELALNRVLVGICGLRVDMMSSDDAFEMKLIIEGDPIADDIALSAQTICPKVLEFLDVNPKWEGGVTGLMQLITLSHINQILTKRVI